MLLLASVTDKLQVLTGSVGPVDVHASWMDNVSGSVVPGRTNTNIVTNGTFDVVASPGANTQRNIKTLHLRNRAASPIAITIQHTDGAVVSQLYQTTLQPEQTLQYIDEVGFLATGGGPGPTGTGGGSGGVGFFLTGDVKLTLKVVADPGWVLMNDGSIGNPASGGTARANLDTQSLFMLLYANIPALILQDNTGATVARGATALADFTANRRLVLPAVLGRALAAAGAGAGLTSHTLGMITGEEKHALSAAEMAAHTHGVNDPTHAHSVADPTHAHSVYDPSHTHGVNDPTHTHDFSGLTIIGYYGTGGIGEAGPVFTSGGGVSPAYTGISIGGAGTGIAIYAAGTGIGIYGAYTGISIQSSGSGAAHNVMQPTSFLNVMIKL